MKVPREYSGGNSAIASMRKLFPFVFFFVSQVALAQKHEVGLTLGGLFSQDRGTVPNALRLSSGVALQANYGYRFIGGRETLYGEVPSLANPQRVVGSGNSAATRDVATLYVTPGLRVKFAADAAISPYVAIGGGYAWYEQSFFRIDGGPNRRRASYTAEHSISGLEPMSNSGDGLAYEARSAISIRAVPPTTFRLLMADSTISSQAVGLRLNQ